MNAKELHDTMAASKAEFPGPAEMRDLILRALRLLAAAEGGDGTPETDAALELEMAELERLHGPMTPPHGKRSFVYTTCERLERERTGLAARVGELEAERDALKRHAEAMANAIQFGDMAILTVAKAAADSYRSDYPKDPK